MNLFLFKGHTRELVLVGLLIDSVTVFTLLTQTFSDHSGVFEEKVHPSTPINQHLFVLVLYNEMMASVSK